MTEPNEPTRNEREPVVPAAGEHPDPANVPQEQAPAETRPEDDTIGTGTSIALGCVAATVLLVILGFIFLILVLVFA